MEVTELKGVLIAMQHRDAMGKLYGLSIPIHPNAADFPLTALHATAKDWPVLYYDRPGISRLITFLTDLRACYDDATLRWPSQPGNSEVDGSTRLTDHANR